MVTRAVGDGFVQNLNNIPASWELEDFVESPLCVGKLRAMDQPRVEGIRSVVRG